MTRNWDKYVYRKVASRNMCYYLENQVFGGTTNRDMSLYETCLYSYSCRFWIIKSYLLACLTQYKSRHVTKRDVLLLAILQYVHFTMIIMKREEIMQIVEEIIKKICSKTTHLLYGVSCLVHQIAVYPFSTSTPQYHGFLSAQSFL